jgi:four helix bundle protein
MKTEELKFRTKEFALRIMKVVDALPKNANGRAIAGQVSRSGTAIAANYRAALRARSDAEFAAKLGVVVEESDETLFWIELIIESELLKKSRLEVLRKEADELTAIFCSMHKTSRRKIINQKS